MFRLPGNLIIGGQVQLTEPWGVAAMEEQLPPCSRILVGLVLAERYAGFEEDCERAEQALRDAGIPVWPEYDRRVTADPDGDTVVWISYQSSPAFWTPILLILGSIFLLPVLGILGVWVVDKLFPGLVDIISTLVVLGLMLGVMTLLPKMLQGGK